MQRFDPSRAALRAFLLAVARNQLRKRWEKERRWDTLEGYTFVARPVDPLAGEVAAPVARAALVLFEYEALTLEEVARTVDAETLVRRAVDDVGARFGAGSSWRCRYSRAAPRGFRQRSCAKSGFLASNRSPKASRTGSKIATMG
ncbi:MAG: hypothetical protein FJW39_14605 [Acidobacteria bacterium]|nr:hypothetical protein [Acidobacteriota bacterium]